MKSICCFVNNTVYAVLYKPHNAVENTSTIMCKFIMMLALTASITLHSGRLARTAPRQREMF